MPHEIGLDKVAEKLKKFNIHGLVVIGGFEVSWINAPLHFLETNMFFSICKSFSSHSSWIHDDEGGFKYRVLSVFYALIK